jgi:hypothetical protein
MLVNFPEDSPRRSPSIAYTSSGPDSRVAATSPAAVDGRCLAETGGTLAPGTRDVRLTAGCARMVVLSGWLSNHRLSAPYLGRRPGRPGIAAHVHRITLGEARTNRAN